MLVLNVEQSALLVEQAIKELGSVVAENDVEKIKHAVYQAWKSLGEARTLLRRPQIERAFLTFSGALAGSTSGFSNRACSLTQALADLDGSFPANLDGLAELLEDDKGASDAPA